MKVGWCVDKRFDESSDRTTWIEVIRNLEERHEVHLITGYKHDKLQFKALKNAIIYVGAPNIPFVKRIGLYAKQIHQIGKFIRTQKPDIMLFNTHNFFLVYMVSSFKNKYGFRAYLDIRSLPVYSSRLKNGLDNILFRKSLEEAARRFDGVTYITEGMRAYCFRTFALPEHKSEVWSSGVDLDVFRPGRNEKKDRTFRLMYHGSIADNRGLDQVVKALHLLSDLEIEFVLLGEGNGVSRLNSLVRALRLDGKILFHSPVPYHHVPHLIRKADAGILPFPDWPAWNVSSPIKLFEYLACNKPVIVTKIPSHVHVLDKKDFAFWAERSEPEALAKAIFKAVSEAKKEKTWRSEPRKLVETHYTWSKQAKKLEDFLCD